MGNVYQLPIVLTDDVVAALAELRSRHAMSSWATVLDADAEVLNRQRGRIVWRSSSAAKDTASPDVVTACDRRVTIPMPSGVRDSLNVAVAANFFV